MPVEHTIVKGECILSLADRYGHKWETIWNASENEKLRKDRGHPGVLAPGDLIVIPDRKPATLSLGTNAKHAIRVAQNLVTVRLRLMQPPPPPKEDPTGGRASPDQKAVTVEDPEPPEPKADEPRANVAWVVMSGGNKLASGKSDGDGHIEFKLKPDVTEAEVIVEPETLKELRLPLALGGLDPVTTVSGVKQRLYNLGLDCGDSGDEAHDNFAAVVAAFQQGQGLPVTGEVDARTRDQLRQVHGF